MYCLHAGSHIPLTIFYLQKFQSLLANMMGLLHHVKDMDFTSDDGVQFLQHILTCSQQLDESIREIVGKAST